MTSTVRRSVVLSLAAIVGLVPFAIDMYLPSLPEIGEDFAVPTWVTQSTLTGYLLLLGMGQLVAGPVSDSLGRRRPLLLGLTLFTVGSVLAIVAPSMWILIVARLLQGMGGAFALVVANSSVRDHASGNAATRLYAVLITMSALAPVIAPSLGGVVDDLFGWRAVFVVLTVLGATTTMAAVFFLPESLPARDRHTERIGAVLAGYGRLLRNRAYVLPLAGFSVVLMVLFSYIGGASYVYQQHYALDSSSFGFVFGATGLAVLVGAGIANRFADRVGSRNLATWGVLSIVAGSALAAIVLLLDGPLWAVVIGMALLLGGLGAGEPALMSMCMSAVHRSTGAAAALLGSAQYVLGALGTILAGVVAAASAAGWGVLLVVLAVVGAALVILAARRVSSELAITH